MPTLRKKFFGVVTNSKTKQQTKQFQASSRTVSRKETRKAFYNPPQEAVYSVLKLEKAHIPCLPKQDKHSLLFDICIICEV